MWLSHSTGCSDKAVQWHLKEKGALMEQIIHVFLWDRFFEAVLSVIATTGGNVWTTFIGLFSGVCQNRVSSHLEVLRLKAIFFPPKSRWKEKWNPYIFFMREIFRHMRWFSFDIIEIFHFWDSETLHFFIISTSKWLKIFQLLKWNTDWCIFLPD